jgi:hypothetical protein
MCRNQKMPWSLTPLKLLIPLRSLYNTVFGRNIGLTMVEVYLAKVSVGTGRIGISIVHRLKRWFRSITRRSLVGAVAAASPRYTPPAADAGETRKLFLPFSRRVDN